MRRFFCIFLNFFIKYCRPGNLGKTWQQWPILPVSTRLIHNRSTGRPFSVFPQKATTTVCLGFCLHPYSMLKPWKIRAKVKYLTFLTEYSTVFSVEVKQKICIISISHFCLDLNTKQIIPDPTRSGFTTLIYIFVTISTRLSLLIVMSYLFRLGRMLSWPGWPSPCLRGRRTAAAAGPEDKTPGLRAFNNPIMWMTAFR